MLRTMGNVVSLLVCRPHDENFRKLSPPTAEPPIPPMRSSFNFKHQQYMNQLESILPPGVSHSFTFFSLSQRYFATDDDKFLCEMFFPLVRLHLGV